MQPIAQLAPEAPCPPLPAPMDVLERMVVVRRPHTRGPHPQDDSTAPPHHLHHLQGSRVRAPWEYSKLHVTACLPTPPPRKQVMCCSLPHSYYTPSHVLPPPPPDTLTTYQNPEPRMASDLRGIKLTEREIGHSKKSLPCQPLTPAIGVFHH